MTMHKLLICLSAALASPNAHATCQESTILKMLEAKFTPDQIMALCPNSATAPTGVPATSTTAPAKTPAVVAVAAPAVVGPPAVAPAGTGTTADVQKPSNAPGLDESKWGVLIAATIDLGKRDRVVNAEVDGNNIVRVSGDNNVAARMLIERHFWANTKGTTDGTKANGPFVAIQPGADNKVIQAIGAGWMWGYRSEKQGGGEALTFSLGVLADPNTKILGDGIYRDQKLPANDTLRYKATTRFGFLMGAGFSF